MFREQSAFLSAGMLLLVLACMLVPTLAAHEGERPCLHCHSARRLYQGLSPGMRREES